MPFRLALLMAGASLASGCTTTTSFAPPRVEVDRQIVSPDPGRCAQLAPATGNALEHNVAGGIDLVDNFVRAYRCAEREAADGRQVFEVPSFLALAAAGLGPALGMSEDAGLVLGGGAAVAGHANSYYAPKQKAAVLDAALDAVLCIKTESVGVDFFDTRKEQNPGVEKAIAETQNAIEQLNGDVRQLTENKAQVQRTLDATASRLRAAPAATEQQAMLAGAAQQQQQAVAQFDAAIAVKARSLSDATETLGRLQRRLLSSVAGPLVIRRTMPDGSTVEVSVSEQYFQMVSAALFQVDRILAQRLSNSGNFDAAGLAAELTALVKTRDDAKTARDKAAAAVAANGGAVAPGNLALMAVAGAAREKANENLVDLSIKLLQPQLQTCILRAKF